MSFFNSLLARIEDLTVDVNDIILSIFDKLKSAAVLKLHKIRSKIHPVRFDKECESLKAIKLKLVRIFRRNKSQDNLQNYLKTRNALQMKSKKSIKKIK